MFIVSYNKIFVTKIDDYVKYTSPETIHISRISTKQASQKTKINRAMKIYTCYKFKQVMPTTHIRV